MPESQTTTARPTKPVTLFALSVCFVAAWWGVFHEAVCGFVLSGVGIETLYAYIGCYAHSIGCILGALLAPSVSKRLVGSTRRKGVLVILGIELILTVLIFFHLGMHLPTAPTVLQVPLNALACITALLALETLSRFTFEEVGTVLAAALCSFAIANYAIFPAFIRLPFGIYLIMAVEIAFLAVAAIALQRFYRLSSELEQREESGTLPAETAIGTNPKPNHKAFVWQPVCFLAAYGTAFGLMHVEQSKLVVSFSERSVWLLAGIICATAIISLFILKLNKHKGIWHYYRCVVFPLFMCAFLMLQEREIDVSALAVSAVYASMAAFFMLSLLGCIRISDETAIPVVRVGRTAVCAAYGFALVGASINHALTHIAGIDVLYTPLATVIVFILLCAATFWIGDDKNVSKIWGLRIEKDPKSLRNEEFDRHITSIAERYKLTAKEQAVLSSLAKGKRANQISEEQFISVNTVRTHIRNVYNKMDVHSYQDLLKKLDEE